MNKPTPEELAKFIIAHLKAEGAGEDDPHWMGGWVDERGKGVACLDGNFNIEDLAAAIIDRLEA